MKVSFFEKLTKILLCSLCIITYSCSSGSDISVDDTDIGEEPTLPCNVAEIFANETTNAVCFEEVNNVRKVYTNNFPAHNYGPWAGANTLEAQDFEYSMCLYPELTSTITEIKEDPTSQACGGGIIFGVSDQGINYSPFARLYWVNPNTQEENLDWHVEADFTLAMDLNGGHVNNVSRYHYHNIPTDYFTNDLNINGTKHSPIIGYAADGFPIYYKYLYTDANTTATNPSVSTFASGYSLKSGNRPGDGISAPNGSYDGTYIEDYEYTGADLDECGGRFGVTPEYPNGTYYYVLTDNWPYIPRCFKGKYVDNSFQISPGCPDSTAAQDCSSVAVTSINASVFEDLKNKLDTKLYHKLNTLDYGSRYAESKINQIKIYTTNGTLAYTSNSTNELNKTEIIDLKSFYIQVDFSNGSITKKITA
ncbi:YHYH protein [uncultured Tenacibaculum sp.]|uniref:YHYH protein n=1 Tax=uncultured Tenacibaculum sp. TaxID=174713 RepID=UPI0026070425|nr:YHYH protein [uncultured Tenacibaculum sp.]